jgi:hypothetical protein
MKSIFVTAFIIFSISFSISAQNYSELREMFYKASKDENSSGEFVKKLESIDYKDEPMLLGFKGIAYMFLAKYAFIPFSKLTYFIKGKSFLETAIEKDFYNPELWYFRFAVQVNVPFFLNYSEKIEEDKKAILEGIDNIKDDKFRQHIIQFMLGCHKCSEAEKQKLL